MKALFLDEDRRLSLRETETPVIHAGEVLIKVMRAGICATDLGYVRFGSPKLSLPVILGHEASGVIEAVGEGVSELAPGQRVITMNDYYTCGKCRYCERGDVNMCLKRRSLGSKENGVFAEYVKVPARIVLPLDEAISFEEGALIEPFACGVHALAGQACLKPGDVVFISGPGAIGAGATLYAKAAGCTVAVSGLPVDRPRLEVLRALGIDHTLIAGEDPVEETILALTDGYGADVSVEAAGAYRSLETCLSLTRRKGTVVQLGILHGQPADLSPLIYKELFLHASYSKTVADWRRALSLVKSGKVNLKPLVSQIFPLEEYEAAFEKAAAGSGFKILFDPEQP